VENLKQGSTDWEFGTLVHLRQVQVYKQRLLSLRYPLDFGIPSIFLDGAGSGAAAFAPSIRASCSALPMFMITGINTKPTALTLYLAGTSHKAPPTGSLIRCISG
jgi:hypothetical protein